MAASKKVQSPSENYRVKGGMDKWEGACIGKERKGLRGHQRGKHQLYDDVFLG